MNENKENTIYRGIMIVIITALISSIITTMVVYNRVYDTIDIANVTQNVEAEGLELTLASLRKLLADRYIGELDDKSMIEGAIKGYVSGVGDDYTEYYTPEEMTLQMEATLGNYVGIGIVMVSDLEEGTVLVIEPMSGSPAEASGMLAGDYITKVDDMVVDVTNVDIVVNNIKGEEDTNVVIEVLRGEETLVFDITRKTILENHINADILEEKIGYLEILNFDGGTAAQFLEEYDILQEKGIESLVIDLRFNGGGVVDESLEILELLLNKGDILLITENRDEKEEITKSTQNQYIDIPVVVLINGYSASASEIVAGALKDHNRATLVGTTTYGKGVIQSLLQLSDGSGLKMTTDEYFTPNRNEINKIGIEPDHVVEYSSEEDKQLLKAIELLNK